MLLLSGIREANLSGIELSKNVQELLAEAAVELLYCTAAFPKPSTSKTETATILRDRAKFQSLVQGGLKLIDSESAPRWERRLLNAFRCLELACSLDSQSATGHLIEEYIRASKELALIALEEVHEGKNFVGEMTYKVASYLRQYVQFGLVPPRTLAVAVAQEIRAKDVIQPNALVTIEVLDNTFLKVCPDELSMAAVLIDMKRRGLTAIEGFTERALAVFDMADSIAETTRRTSSISSFLEATHVAYLLYECVTTALDWILKRYEKENVSPPTDLYREKQVAEENRVETLGTLDSTCESLITDPIAHLVGQVLISKRIPTKPDIREFIIDGMSRNPVYPNCLRNGLTDLIQGLDFGNPPDYEAAIWRLQRLLDGSMRDLFNRSFSDDLIARVVIALQNKWPHEVYVRDTVRQVLNRGRVF